MLLCSVGSVFQQLCRMGMNVIYCGPESGNLMSCGVWMICSVAGVVCHSGFCDCGLGVPEWDHLELLL